MVGPVFNIAVAPLDEEATTWFPASTVTIGLEYRRLSAERLKTAMDERPEIARVLGGTDFAATQGWSIHVMDGKDHHEYLRFDCFHSDAHYHYLHRLAEGETVMNHVYFFDDTADGPMWDWVKDRIRTRLPEMLQKTRGDHLLPGLDMAAVDRAMQAIDDQVAHLQTEPEPA